MDWQKIASAADVEKAEQESHGKPVLIYKHSHRCHICTMALSRIERAWEAGDEARLTPYFLDVIGCREASDLVASRYGVNHESPQALVIRNGKCVFQASHSAITYNDIMSAAG